MLQEWVEEIPLREQGVLVLALRGPDGVRKEHGAKNLVRAMRACVMNTGATGQPLVPGTNLPDDSFMQMFRVGHVDDGPWQEACIEFYRSWDEFNVHFLFHFAHAAAILGIRYSINNENSTERIRKRWWDLYLRCVHKCHCNPETPEQIINRLKDGHKPDDPE